MPALLFLLIIAPLLLGALINMILKPEDSGFIPFYAVLGFLAMTAVFAALCYPATLLNIPFHSLCLAACLLYAAGCVIALIMLIRRRAGTKKPGGRFVAWLSSCLRSPAFWLMILICGAQILRLYYNEPYQPRDSKTYFAIINDIIGSDRLFRNAPFTGEALSSLADVKAKYLFSPWYPFIAMLAKVSGLHPLMIEGTVLPPYLLLLHYLMLYALGKWLLEGSRQRAFLFVFICAFLREISVTISTPSMIQLIWPLWGKGVFVSLVTPALLLLYMLRYQDAGYRKAGISIMIILTVIAGCSMSTMSILIIPFELGLLGLVQAIRRRGVIPLIAAAAYCLPSLIYTGIYFMVAH